MTHSAPWRSQARSPAPSVARSGAPRHASFSTDDTILILPQSRMTNDWLPLTTVATRTTKPLATLSCRLAPGSSKTAGSGPHTAAACELRLMTHTVVSITKVAVPSSLAATARRVEVRVGTIGSV